MAAFPFCAAVVAAELAYAAPAPAIEERSTLGLYDDDDDDDDIVAWPVVCATGACALQLAPECAGEADDAGGRQDVPFAYK